MKEKQMLNNFWQRARRISQAVKEIGSKSARKIAEVTGISKSAVSRHLRAERKRNKYPESYLWESAAGQLWLVRLVVAVIFHFGIKRGAGAETISEFFRAIRIETHVGTSPTAIRNMRQQIEALILEYGEKYQEEGAKNSDSLEVTGGVDETFFNQMMILVLLDLRSGYILMEEASDNRTYKTWKEKVEKVLKNLNANVHYLVSDRAKALISLATKYFEVASIADLFHALHKIAQTFSFALRNKINACQKELEKLEAKLAKISEKEKDEDNRLLELKQKVVATAGRLKILQNAYERYRLLLRKFSLIVHPFNYENNKAQSSHDVEEKLVKIIKGLKEIAKQFDLNYKKLKTVKKQLPDIACLMDIWWNRFDSSLSQLALDNETKKWIKEKLLPYIYWKNQISKTNSKEIRLLYQAAYQNAKKSLIDDPFSSTIDPPLRSQLEEWAQTMVDRFCRTSSAVEGRNGALSQLNHSRRGLRKKRLPVLTVLHNFEQRRADGTTAAERFFGQEFPDLFEWLLPQITSIPRPRIRGAVG